MIAYTLGEWLLSIPCGIVMLGIGGMWWANNAQHIKDVIQKNDIRAYTKPEAYNHHHSKPNPNAADDADIEGHL